MPALQKFYDRYKNEAFTIVGMYNGETIEEVRKFVTDFRLTFPIWLAPGYKSEKAFGTISLPSSYVINRQGTVRLIWIGAIDFSSLENYVKPMLLE